MQLSNERKGDLAALFGAFTWGLAPIFIVSAKDILPPLLFAGSSFLFAGLFFLVLQVVKNPNALAVPKRAIQPLLLGTLIIVGFGFSLLFTVGRITSPQNIAIIGQAEMFFSFLLFGVILNHEAITAKRIFGALLTCMGVILVIADDYEAGVLWANLALLFATMIYPIGNYFQKEALKYISALTLMTYRNIIAGFGILVVGFAIEDVAELTTNLAESLVLIAATGLIAFGLSKWAVLFAFATIGVAKAISLNAIAPAVTFLVTLMIWQTAPTLLELLGLSVILIGVPLIVAKAKFSFTGIVESGDKIGSKLGFPTINIKSKKRIPFGVYAAFLHVDDRDYQGVIHIGPRPTLGKTALRKEIHLLEKVPNISAGKSVRVTVIDKIRDVKPFANKTELAKRIAEDVLEAKRIHHITDAL
jgi:drug/metabolite transporter (DMT)-like permease